MRELKEESTTWINRMGNLAVGRAPRRHRAGGGKTVRGGRVMRHLPDPGFTFTA